MGLRGGSDGEGASRVRGDQRRVSPLGPDELRRDQRPGALHPHGGAVVHTRPALRGRLGDSRLQRQGRVSTQQLGYEFILFLCHIHVTGRLKNTEFC